MQQQTDRPLEINDLMAAIVAKALRWETTLTRTECPPFTKRAWSDFDEAEGALRQAVKDYRTFLKETDDGGE